MPATDVRIPPPLPFAQAPEATGAELAGGVRGLTGCFGVGPVACTCGDREGCGAPSRWE